MASYGHWFVSQKFDDRWSLKTLIAVLRLTKKTDSESTVVKRLAELCQQYPADCLASLRLMIEGDEGWLLLAVEDDARQILRLAIDSNNPDVSPAARRLAEDLIARGHFQFRSLLDHPTSSAS